MPLIKLVMIIACMAAGILVAALNPDPVTLDLVVWRIEVPAGQLLLFALLLGALIGGLTVALTRWLDSRRGNSSPSTRTAPP